MWFSRNKEVKQQKEVSKGRAMERQAEQFLIQRGLITLDKNYRSIYGEIDLIMSYENTLVFVEVRLRTHQKFSSAAETVDYRKQQKIIKTAQQFLQQQGLTDKVPCRFDIIACAELNGSASNIEWIKDAFSI